VTAEWTIFPIAEDLMRRQVWELVSIDMTNGSSAHVLSLDAGTPFYGAGVTTLAPRVP
jgi:hypothetical protein